MSASVCASEIYKRFTAFYNTEDEFKRCNPESLLCKYNECTLNGPYFVIYVRGIRSLPDSVADSMRAWFDARDCRLLWNRDGTTEFSVPFSAVMPRRRFLFDFVDELTQPRNLLIILISLVVLFLSLFFVFAVPDEDKRAWVRGIGSWFFKPAAK